jgi:hypothetical protein
MKSPCCTPDFFNFVNKLFVACIRSPFARSNTNLCDNCFRKFNASISYISYPHVRLVVVLCPFHCHSFVWFIIHNNSALFISTPSPWYSYNSPNILRLNMSWGIHFNAVWFVLLLLNKSNSIIKLMFAYIHLFFVWSIALDHILEWRVDEKWVLCEFALSPRLSIVHTSATCTLNHLISGQSFIVLYF